MWPHRFLGGTSYLNIKWHHCSFNHKLGGALGEKAPAATLHYSHLTKAEFIIVATTRTAALPVRPQALCASFFGGCVHC